MRAGEVVFHARVMRWGERDVAPVLPILRMAAGVGVVIGRANPLAYHRVRRRQPEGSGRKPRTRRLKEHLKDAIARHERIAAEIERASEAGADAVYPKGK
jgi:hypothetical protein